MEYLRGEFKSWTEKGNHSSKWGTAKYYSPNIGVEAAVKGIEIVGATVGEASLGVCPHDFVRIELKGGGRKELEVETRVTATQRPNRLVVVDRSIVQKHVTCSLIMDTLVMRPRPAAFQDILKCAAGARGTERKEANRLRRLRA